MSHDLRLLPAAIAAWVLSIVVVSGCTAIVDPAARRGVAAAACAVGVFAVALGSAAVLRSHRLAVGVACVAGAASVMAAAIHVLSLTADPLAAAADQRQVVSISGVVASDWADVPGGPPWSADDRSQAPVRLQRVVIRGSAYDVDVPILLRVTTADSSPVPGSVIEATARLSPPLGRPDVAAVATATSEVATIAGPGLIAVGANAVRAGLLGALSGLPAEPASLVAGLAIGDESLQSEEFADRMRVAGLSHLTAVSGGNVAIVLVAVLAIARLLALRRRPRAVLALGALVAFVIVVRPQPSVLRAAVMGSVVIIALIAGGRRRGLPALAAAVILLVIISPTLSVSLGFALSVLATAGLLWIAPLARDRLMAMRCPPALAEAIAVAFAAQVATVPLIAALGNGVGLLTIPSNLLAMPVVPVVTILGLLAAIAAVVAPPVAAWAAFLAIPFASWIAGVATTVARLPAATLPWPEGPVGAAAALGVTAVGAWVIRRGMQRVAAPVAAACLVLALVRPVPGWPPAGWVLVACDVGQGDALVIRSADAAVVVDVGPDPVSVDRCLDQLGIGVIAAVVLTHFHADHVDGLAGVLDGRAVGSIVISPVSDPPEEAALVAQVAADRRIPVRVATIGERVSIGGVLWEVIWPRRVIEESRPNNSSVVLLVESAQADGRGIRMLLCADVEPLAQVAMRAATPPPRADIVKVPHHGSRHQDPALPAWSGARVALVSAGEDNSYGHPADMTLTAWQSAGAIVGRTDLQGDLAVVYDPGGDLSLVTRR